MDNREFRRADFKLAFQEKLVHTVRERVALRRSGVDPPPPRVIIIPPNSVKPYRESDQLLSDTRDECHSDHSGVDVMESEFGITFRRGSIEHSGGMEGDDVKTMLKMGREMESPYINGAASVNRLFI